MNDSQQAGPCTEWMLSARYLRARRFYLLHCSRSVPFNPAAAHLMITLPNTMLVFGHAAGPLVQNAVLKAAMDLGDPSAAVPYIEATDRFGVSRTHVRNLMISAEAAGSSGSSDAEAATSRYFRASGQAMTAGSRSACT